MNQNEKIILLVVLALVVIVVIYLLCRPFESHSHIDQTGSTSCSHTDITTCPSCCQNQIDSLADDVDGLINAGMGTGATEKWRMTVQGNRNISLDNVGTGYIANSRAYDVAGGGILAHKFDGTPGVPYDIDLTLTANGTNPSGCDLVIEEVPMSEAAIGTYTAAAQVMASQNISISTAADLLKTESTTVTPTLTDSLWLYSCQGGASTYPITLRVEEQ